MSIKTRIKALDMVTGGLERGELICIAGRRSVGKTGFAVNILNGICAGGDKGCLYFSLDEDAGHIRRKLSGIPDKNLHIDDRAFSIKEIEKVCQKIGKKKRLDIIVIDHIHLVWAKGGNRSLVSNRLKKLARTLDCTVLVMAMLDRSVDLREDKRPVLSDLNAVGEMDLYADKVLLLYRDDYYNIDSGQKGILEVTVARNNYGKAIGTVNLSYRRY